MPAETARSQGQGSRRPVVRIRYAAPGESTAKELPFVVAVMANFAGDGLSSLPTFRQREFEPVDRHRFDALFNLYRPALTLRAPHVLGDSPDEDLVVSLQFRSLDDFSPRGVALQVPELRRLVEARAQIRRQRDRCEAESADPAQVLEPLERQMLELDRRISALLDVILHHPKFQKLEASWRGVQYLVNQTPYIDPNDPREKPRVKVLMLCVGWNELDRDFRDRVEFDQSTLFRKVYDDNFGMAGGEPIGLLIGDYTIRPQGSAEAASADDHELLKDISHVAAAAFCPFVAGLSPQFLGADSFADFEYRGNVDNVFGRLPNKIVWKSFREAEDSRFVGLAAPRVLLRQPWTTEYFSDAGTGGLFRYEEDARDPGLTRLLWGHAGWAFGEIAIRSFLQGGWFADMTGVQPGEITRGVVVGLPETCFGADRPGLQPKPPVDLSIDEEFGEVLTRNGLLALCRSYGSASPAFFAAPSIQEAKNFDTASASANAWLSASLETMLCVGRFAHHVKMLGRDLLGSTQSHEELQRLLHNWIVQYVTDLPNPSPEQRAKRPLSAAQVIVQPDAGRLGGFRCEMHLKPHFSLERMVASIRLRTILSPASSSAAVA